MSQKLGLWGLKKAAYLWDQVLPCCLHIYTSMNKQSYMFSGYENVILIIFISEPLDSTSTG